MTTETLLLLSALTLAFGFALGMGIAWTADRLMKWWAA